MLLIRRIVGLVTIKFVVFETPFQVAVTGTMVWVVTCLEVIEKLGERVAPAGIVTVAGTPSKSGRVVEIATTAPVAGAAAVRTTALLLLSTPPEMVPGINSRRLSVTEDAVPGLTVSTTALCAPLYDAVMVACVEVLTVCGEIVKVADICPPGTVTDAGTAATADALEDNVTTAPPDKAALVRTTVPVTGLSAVVAEVEVVRAPIDTPVPVVTVSEAVF